MARRPGKLDDRSWRDAVEVVEADVLDPESVKKAATGPLVTKVFIPLSTQRSPSRAAIVLQPVRSLEWSGSVRQNAATSSPRIAGRK